jgi:tetratricopeptide (TPR) repeat protein
MSVGLRFVALGFLMVLTGCSARRLVRDGDRYLDAGHAAAAVRAFERAAVERPADTSIQLRLARARLAEEKPSLAIAPARRALEAHVPGAGLVLLDALLSVGDLEGAATLMASLATYDAVYARNPGVYDLGARLALARGDFASAYERLDAALEMDRTGPRLAFKAYLYARQGRFQEAGAAADGAQAFAPDQIAMVGDLAATFFMAGQEKRREALGADFAACFPAGPAELAASARRARANGDLSEAIRRAAWVAAWKPDNGENLLLLGDFHLAARELRWAIRFLELALQQDPFKTSLGGKGIVKPIVLRSDEVTAIYRKLTVAHEGLDEPAEAAEYLEQALVLSHGSLAADWLRVARLRVAARDPSGAVRAAQMALRDEPRNVEAHELIARVLLQQNQLDAAVGYALLAWQGDPGDPRVSLLLGGLYAMREEYEAARSIYTSALQNHPAQRELRQALDRLPPGD